MKTHILMLMLLFSGLAFAQDPQPAPDPGKQSFKEKMGLTDEQTAKIKEIKLSAKKEILPLKNELGEKKARLKTLSTADKVNMNEINGVIDDITSLKGRMMKIKMKKHQDIRALLTDEQRVMFDTHKGRKKAHKHKVKHGPPAGMER